MTNNSVSAAGFAGLVAPGGVIPALPAFSREAALLALARAAAPGLGLAALQIHERLVQREALASTGTGGGAAIPHARLPQLRSACVMLVRLAQPVEWDAVDGLPVDLVVLLLSPEGHDADHLKLLARISRTLRDPATLAALRQAGSADEMLALITPQRIAAE